jgi:hypothetical protein
VCVQAGSFLLARLRHWVAEHNLEFPLSRTALLLLEAQLLKPTNPDAAASLLQAVLASADGTAGVRYANVDVAYRHAWLNVYSSMHL